MTDAARRIGVPPDPVLRPLLTRLHGAGLDLVRDSPGALAMKLRAQELDGAFLSPLDASRGLPACRPLRGAALVARAGSGTAVLQFRSGIRTVRTVAADPGRTSEIVLATIVLKEQYGVTPQIVPAPGSPREALGRCDAALAVGDPAGAAADGLDLVAGWSELSELPFVHALWYVRDGSFGGGGGVDERIFAPPEAAAGAGAETPAVEWRFDGDARAGLAEFVRMAYYHGILGEIPEFGTFMPDPEN